jgi:peptidoglycan hydrolase-like protein with peptidoglycan-binding domain
MENLAYIHLASAYESTSPSQLALASDRFSSFRSLKSLKLPGWVLLRFLRLLSAVVILAVVSLASAVYALENGDIGSEVIALQTRLSNQGYYDGPITGYYGSLTEEAVARFQQDRGLNADGIAGERTLSALEGDNLEPTTAGSLRLGATGDAVSTLQNSLRAVGFYDGPTTGYFGSSTEDAVIRFQQAKGLSVDGIVGSSTQAALDNDTRFAVAPSYSNQVYESPPRSNSFSTSQSLRQGDSGDAVSTLQTRLKAAGFYDGPITGYFGSLTESAVIRFQQARGLRADGVVGSATASALPGSRPNPSVTAANQFSVLELQRRLKARGFYAGSLDGDMGPSTQRAIAAAQRFYGVSDRDVRNGRF